MHMGQERVLGYAVLALFSAGFIYFIATGVGATSSTLSRGQSNGELIVEDEGSWDDTDMNSSLSMYAANTHTTNAVIDANASVNQEPPAQQANIGEVSSEGDIRENAADSALTSNEQVTPSTSDITTQSESAQSESHQLTADANSSQLNTLSAGEQPLTTLNADNSLLAEPNAKEQDQVSNEAAPSQESSQTQVSTQNIQDADQVSFSKLRNSREYRDTIA